MKKLALTFAFLIQTVFLFAAELESGKAVALYDNVKMYTQPGTSTMVVKALKNSEELVVVRKHNANWTIIQVDGKVGYVLTSELTKFKESKSDLVGKAIANR